MFESRSYKRMEDFDLWLCIKRCFITVANRREDAHENAGFCPCRTGVARQESGRYKGAVSLDMSVSPRLSPVLEQRRARFVVSDISGTECMALSSPMLSAVGIGTYRPRIKNMCNIRQVLPVSWESTATSNVDLGCPADG
jgi:hypothetical protein